MYIKYFDIILILHQEKVKRFQNLKMQKTSRIAVVKNSGLKFLKKQSLLIYI